MDPLGTLGSRKGPAPDLRVGAHQGAPRVSGIAAPSVSASCSLGAPRGPASTIASIAPRTGRGCWWRGRELKEDKKRGPQIRQKHADEIFRSPALPYAIGRGGPGWMTGSGSRSVASAPRSMVKLRTGRLGPTRSGGDPQDGRGRERVMGEGMDSTAAAGGGAFTPMALKQWHVSSVRPMLRRAHRLSAATVLRAPGG